MTEVEDLQKQVAEKELFIKNILAEMKQIYELFDDLRTEADLLSTEFLQMMKEFQ